MISDEELDAMIAMQGTMAISAAIEQLPIASERHKKTCEALTEHLALRRRDAAIEKALKQEPGSFLSVEPVANVRTMASIYSESGDTLHEAEGESMSEALSALAAGLEGGG